MGWETFRKFHDCYLHTDVLALADVMESYRDSPGAVGAQPHPLRHAARGRLGRHAASARETPIHLITDEQAYKDVRSPIFLFQCFRPTPISRELFANP